MVARAPWLPAAVGTQVGLDRFGLDRILDACVDRLPVVPVGSDRIGSVQIGLVRMPELTGCLC